MNGYKKRKELMRGRIRQAAYGLFKTYGFKKVSMGEIASKAGISPVTIYNHFNNKEELVRDIIVTQLTTVIDKYQEILDSKIEFADKISLIILDRSSIMREYQGEYIRNLFLDDPDARGLLENLWQQETKPLIAKLINQGREEGVITGDIPNETYWFYFEVLRKGFNENMELGMSMDTNEAMLRDIEKIILYGIVVKK